MTNEELGTDLASRLLEMNARVLTLALDLERLRKDFNDFALAAKEARTPIPPAPDVPKASYSVPPSTPDVPWRERAGEEEWGVI